MCFDVPVTRMVTMRLEETIISTTVWRVTLTLYAITVSFRLTVLKKDLRAIALYLAISTVTLRTSNAKCTLLM